MPNAIGLPFASTTAGPALEVEEAVEPSVLRYGAPDSDICNIDKPIPSMIFSSCSFMESLSNDIVLLLLLVLSGRIVVPSST